MPWYLRSIFSAVLILISVSVHAGMIHLSDIQVINTETNTRLIFTLSEPTRLHVFMLTHPTRVVADFEDAHLAKQLKNLGFPSPQIQSIRSGYPKPGTLRLVLNTPEGVHFAGASTERNTQFVLDVFLPSARSNTFLSKKNPSRRNISQQSVVSTTVQKQDIPLQAAMNAGMREISSQSIENPASAKSKVTSTVIASPTAILHTNQHHSITIVIDPGHGGKDPGALGIHGTCEKDVVLAIAKRLAALINKQPNMHAILTRSGDYFVPLRDRLRLARKGNADLFMSIHADSYFNTLASGVSVYTLSHRGATSEAARWLARRENYSELGGVDLGELRDQSYLLRSVLIDLAQTATIRDSMRFGVSMLDSLDEVAPLHYSRVEQAPFMVLKSPDIPSVLVETGFISNANEELRLRDVKYQTRITQALYDGIHSYLKKNPQTG